MWIEVEYKSTALASQSGDRKALPSSIEPLNLSQTYLSGNERTHDLELWFPWTKTAELAYRLDPALKAVNVPEEAELKESFGNFTRKVLLENGVVRIIDTCELLSQRIPKADYAKFSAFCRKVDSLLSQKVLLEAK